MASSIRVGAPPALLVAFLLAGPAGAAEVRGTVRDALSGGPLDGVVLELAETAHQATSSARGGLLAARRASGAVPASGEPRGVPACRGRGAGRRRAGPPRARAPARPRGRGGHRDRAGRRAAGVRRPGVGVVARERRALPAGPALDAGDAHRGDRRLRAEDEPRRRVAVRPGPDRQPGAADGGRHPPQQLDLPVRAQPVPRHGGPPLDRAGRGGARLRLDTLRQRRDRRGGERAQPRAALRGREAPTPRRASSCGA